MGEVVIDRRGIVLGRRAIAAGARSDDFDRLSGAHLALGIALGAAGGCETCSEKFGAQI